MSSVWVEISVVGSSTREVPVTFSTSGWETLIVGSSLVICSTSGWETVSGTLQSSMESDAGAMQEGRGTGE